MPCATLANDQLSEETSLDWVKQKKMIVFVFERKPSGSRHQVCGIADKDIKFVSLLSGSRHQVCVIARL
jgi:hypothetical protein